MSKHHRQIDRLPLLSTCVLLLVLTLSGMVTPAYANGASNAQQAAQVAIQQNGGGKVLGVSTETDNNGRRVFAVKILSNNGRVRIVRIPQS